MAVFLASDYSGLNQAVVGRREWSEHTSGYGEHGSATLCDEMTMRAVPGDVGGNGR